VLLNTKSYLLRTPKGLLDKSSHASNRFVDPHSPLQTGTYLAIDGTAGMIVALTFLLSRLLPVNNGILVASLEVLTSLSVVTFLFLQRDRMRELNTRLIFLLFSLLLFGDLCYGYFYYWLQIGAPTRASVLFHEVPLSLSYFLLPILYLHCMGGSIRKILFHPFSIVPLVISLTLMARFVFPLTHPVATSVDPLIRGVESFSLLCTFVGLVLSITVFVFAKDLFWSLFSLGMTTSYIAGLGIRIDRLSGDAVQFTSFECLWAFGGLLSAMAVIYLWTGKETITFTRQRSIVFSARMMGLMVAFAGSIILSITRWTELQAVETIILTSVISLHLAGVLGHYLWDRMVECSTAMEKLFRSELVESDEVPALELGVPVEMGELYAKTVKTRLLEFKRTSDLQKEMEISRQIEATAKQVAHDIRSPLAALEVCLKDLTNLPEGRRALLRGSVNRLRDISNLLRNKSYDACPSENSSADAASPISVQMIPGLIDELISEKRMQYRAKMDVEIDVDLGRDAYGVFAEVNPVEFKRLVSNLIDNAVEAIHGKGKVLVRFAKNETQIECLITDDGVGITSYILPQLGKKGASFGKPSGQGLGLYHAKASIESWNGVLSIDSKPGKGTTMTITLPRAVAPDWFIPSVNLSRRHTVVILDDETSVHRVWKERFDTFTEDSGIPIDRIHCSTPESFTTFCHSPRAKSTPVIYLCDHELVNGSRTGLELIEDLNIADRSILVTSRYEETDIRRQCARLGVKLIPKGLAGFVPIVASQI